MKRPIEPGLMRLFRYFALIGLVYFSARWFYETLSVESSLASSVQLVNYIVVHGLLFLILSIRWFERRLKDYFLPVVLVLYTISMVFVSLLYLFVEHPDINQFVSNSYSLVPILMVPVVFIAWQYDYHAVLIYTLVTNFADLLMSILIVQRVTLSTLSVLSMPAIRAFAFGLVGFIVSQLNDVQRQQKHKLLLANLQLAEFANTLESLATSRERNRLARELHDTLAHTLSGISVNLEAIKTLLGGRENELSAMLDDSLLAARRGLNETRRALKDLRAQPLEDLGLEVALRSLAASLSEREGLGAQVDVQELTRMLPPSVEQSFYRIAQEAFENISTHAQAHNFSLYFAEEGNLVKLKIVDDGVGFNTSATPEPDRFGLKGMRERAAAIGAELEIHSSATAGTEVILTWERVQ